MGTQHRTASKALLSVFLLLAASCAEPDDVRLERAAAQFHARLRESKFREIYWEASRGLVDDIGEEEFVAKLKAISSYVGEIQAIEEAEGWKSTPPEITELGGGNKSGFKAYDLKGASGSCTELLFWRIRGGEVRLSKYECKLHPK